MENLPEKIYLYDKADPSDSLQICSPLNFEGSIEYIRKDVAEQMAKGFAAFMVGGEYTLWEDGAWLGHNDDNTRFTVNIDELFTEFLNSRKK